jgi:hypothetical protein
MTVVDQEIASRNVARCSSTRPVSPRKTRFLDKSGRQRAFDLTHKRSSLNFNMRCTLVNRVPQLLEWIMGTQPGGGIPYEKSFSPQTDHRVDTRAVQEIPLPQVG